MAIIKGKRIICRSLKKNCFSLTFAYVVMISLEEREGLKILAYSLALNFYC